MEHFVGYDFLQRAAALAAGCQHDDFLEPFVAGSVIHLALGFAWEAVADPPPPTVDGGRGDFSEAHAGKAEG